MTACYLLKNDGNLMPCTTEGVTTDTGMVEVFSPNGTEYSANPANLVSQAHAGEMLRDRRAGKLAGEGYQCMHLRGDRWRVWSPKRHGNTGGYCVTVGEERSCTCPDAAKGHTCKHVRGIDDLIRYAQIQKPTVRVTAATGPVAPVAPVAPVERAGENAQSDCATRENAQSDCATRENAQSDCATREITPGVDEQLQAAINAWDARGDYYAKKAERRVTITVNKPGAKLAAMIARDGWQ